jgi:uncharacterized protein (TIGR02001 family)
LPRAPANRFRLRCALLLAGLAGASVAPAATNPGGSIAASSDYILRGVSQNNNQPVVQLDLHLQPSDSWSAGVWASPVQPLPGRHSLEVDVYGQWRLPLGDAASATLGATWYSYPGDPRPVTYDYVEYSAGISWHDRVSLHGYYAPRATLFSSAYRLLVHRATWSTELGFAQPLPRQYSATAGLGYYDAVGLDNAGYAYGNLAMGRDFGRIHAELSYVAVAVAAHRGYTQGPAGRPLSMSLAWRF